MEHYKMMSSNRMIHCMQELDEVRRTILAVLISHKKGCTLNELNKSYYELEGKPVPYRKFGHQSVMDFLESMPDIVKIEESNNETIIWGIPSDKTMHIKKLVAGQNDQKIPSRRSFRPSPCYPATHPCTAFVPPAMLAKLVIFVEQHPEGVKINYILREICAHMSHISLTKDDLCEQLQWLSHRIYCELNKVYPKKYQNKQEPSNSEYAGYSLTKMFNHNVKVNGNILISDHTKSQLEKLINKHSDGIWSQDLPNAYLYEYGVHLYYIELGFNSVLEFASVLPEIFNVVRCQRTGCFKLFYSKRAVPSFEVKRVEEIPRDQATKVEVIPSKTPNDVMVIGDYVEPIKVADIECNVLDMVEVNVCEVYTPSVFWIRLRRNARTFKKFRAQFHNFYLQEHKKYQIPCDIIEKGLYCACKYDGQWDRAIISKVQENRVTVVFLDYGTLKSYPPDSLYYLHKTFSHLPSQAILCNLYNVKPYHNSHWPYDAREMFALMTIQKDLVAIVMSRDKEKNSMSITLTDTRKRDIHITDVLLDLDLATIGTIIPIKSENFPFQYYLECKRRKETEVERTSSVAVNDDVESREVAREENVESEREENVESEREENKENDLYYNVAMELLEWGNNTSTNIVSNSINSQNNGPKNSVCKKPNENLVNDTFFKAVKNSSGYMSCNRLIPYTRSGNITEKFNYEFLNLENISDDDGNNTNVLTKAEDRRENDVSKVLRSDFIDKVNGINITEAVNGNITKELSISSKDGSEVQSEPFYQNNGTENTSSDETFNNNVETPKKDTLTDANTLTRRQQILLIKKVLNIRQIKSDSDDMSVSETELESLRENHSLNDTDLSSDLVKTETKSVPMENVETNTKEDFRLLEEGSFSNSSSQIEGPVEVSRENRRQSMNDSSLNSDLEKRETKLVSIRNIEPETRKDVDSLEESLEGSSNVSSEIEGPVEMLDENSLITNNATIPIFNDIDLDSISNYDISDPLSLFSEINRYSIINNEEEDSGAEGISIKEINDSDSNDQTFRKEGKLGKSRSFEF